MALTRQRILGLPGPPPHSTTAVGGCGGGLLAGLTASPPMSRPSDTIPSLHPAVVGGVGEVCVSVPSPASSFIPILSVSLSSSILHSSFVIVAIMRLANCVLERSADGATIGTRWWRDHRDALMV